MIHLAYAGGSAGDEDDLAGDVFMEEKGQEREEALESLVGWQQKQESEEGEGRSYKVQEHVNKIHGRG